MNQKNQAAHPTHGHTIQSQKDSSVRNVTSDSEQLIQTENNIRKLWGSLNTLVFKGSLPLSTRIVLSKLEDHEMGYYHPEFNLIEINASLIGRTQKLIDTLLHEMVHQQQYAETGQVDHNSAFDALMVEYGMEE
jgi:hypothetical protein